MASLTFVLPIAAISMNTSASGSGDPNAASWAVTVYDASGNTLVITPAANGSKDDVANFAQQLLETVR